MILGITWVIYQQHISWSHWQITVVIWNLIGIALKLESNWQRLMTNRIYFREGWPFELWPSWTWNWNLLAEKEGRHYHLMSSANLQNKTTWVECSAVFSISVAPVFLLQKKLKEAALCMDTAAASNQPSWSLLWVTRHNWDLLQRPRLRYYLIYIYLILDTETSKIKRL